LAGEKLSMGVSLPFVDVVMMLNDKFSPDDIIQKMYRAVTPSPGKKTAFIVDFTPERTLTAVYGYTKAASPDSMSPSQILKILLQTYYWDADILPSNASERNHLLAHRNTFQGSLRKLYQNAVGNTGAKQEALEQEITRMQDHFLGQDRKPREKLSLNYRNLVHPNNRLILDEYHTTYEQKQAALKTLQKQFRETPQRNRANELESLLTNFRTYSKTFANTIAATRKQRKALNSASTQKVKKATVLTEAAAAKIAEKERLKQEAIAVKLAEKAEKERLKQEIAAVKLAEKAALKAEKNAAKLLSGTRKKKTTV
jgi:hypothetical protein